MIVAAAVEPLNKAFAVLALVGLGLLALYALLVLVGLVTRFAALKRLRWFVLDPTAIWQAFIVAAIATGGSLYFSQIAGYVPCELCWFQRICMYPLSITLLLMGLFRDRRPVRYLLPLPIVGLGVSLYHIAVENKWVSKPTQCSLGAADCGTKWINEFNFVTIPTLAAVAFALLILLMAYAAFPLADEDQEYVEEGPRPRTPPRATASVPAQPIKPRPTREAKAAAVPERSSAGVS